jgi:DNA end-binding protein Ku
VARALWSGAISFGLVNVPVKLYTATPSSSAHGIALHRLHAPCGTRINHVRRCPTCNVDVPWDDVVSGYEFKKGRFAVISKDEMPEPDRGEIGAVAIEDFVDAQEIDPLLFDRAYWVVPDGTPRAYALLRQALEDAGRVAVARVVVRTRSHLAVLRPVGTHLVLHTLFFHGESVPEQEIPAGSDGVEVPPRELALARELVERMTSPFEHGKYADVTTERMRKLIEEKIATKDVAGPGPVQVGEGEVVDIMEALRRSVERTARERAESAMVASPSGAAGTSPRPAGGGRRRQRAAARPSRKSGGA